MANFRLLLSDMHMRSSSFVKHQWTIVPDRQTLERWEMAQSSAYGQICTLMSFIFHIRKHIGQKSKIPRGRLMTSNHEGVHIQFCLRFNKLPLYQL